MSETPFYKTRMGEKFICKTVPDLIKAVERLASDLEDKRDPAIQELIDYAGDLVGSADRVLTVEIVPGSKRTRNAFDDLRGYTAAVRRILIKIESGRV